MFRRLTSLFISFCCLYHYSFCDCFYIFDVGQGNCQLAVFETEGEKTKIGIMYDCGSSSSKEHVKIHELKRNVSNSDQDGYHYIFKKFEKQSSKKRSNKDMSPSAKKGYSEDNYEKMSQGSISEGTKTPTSNRKKSIVSEIQKIINELKYLFIIFSHPDKDHINLFNGEQNAENVILPQNLDVGVWYGGRYWNKTGVAKDVQRSLNNEQSHTFPLIDCGKRVGATINERLPKEMSTKFTTKEREILENIYIACPRLKFGNVNSRSTVVKIKMSKLGMQFFLTGDAEAKTFSSIEEIDKDFFKKEKGYISFVMLPHHGSKDNTSDNLFELFKPDIIGISAGDGWFCHPMKELFVEKMKGRINNPEYEITFWEKFYQEEVSKLMITYLKTKENKMLLS